MVCRSCTWTNDPGGGDNSSKRRPLSDKLRFGEILVRAGALARDQLQQVLAEVEHTAVDLGEVLVARGLIEEPEMLQALSMSLNLPCVGLDRVAPDPRALKLVPRDLCVRHHLIPVEVEKSRTGEHLHVAMANPADVRAIKVVTRHARLRIRPLIAGAREIHLAIQKHYGGAPIPPVAMEQASLSQAPSAPAAPLGSPAGEGEMFDFGVTDLSALQEEEGPPPRLEQPAPPSPLVSEPPSTGSSLDPFPARVSRPPAGIGARLVDALDSAGMDTLVSTSDLGAVHEPSTLEGEATGYVRRTRRQRQQDRVRTTAPEDAGPKELPRRPPLPGGSVPKKLPTTPPGLDFEETAPLGPPPVGGSPETVNIGVLETAAAMPVMSFATPGIAPGSPPESSSPEPQGLVDDPDRFGLQGMLDRYMGPVEEAREDGVIADVAERYGESSVAPPEDAWSKLVHVVESEPDSGRRLLLALVGHLGRRGIVDLAELLAELEEANPVAEK